MSGVHSMCERSWCKKILHYHVPFFFRNSLSFHYWLFCVTLNGNKLEKVANQMNLNTNLDSVKGLLN